MPHNPTTDHPIGFITHLIYPTFIRQICKTLKHLKARVLAELCEIEKALGIPHHTPPYDEKDLIEKILNFTQDGGVAIPKRNKAPPLPRKPVGRVLPRRNPLRPPSKYGSNPRTDHDDTDSAARQKEGGKRRGRPPARNRPPFIRRHRYFQTRDKNRPDGEMSRNARGTADTFTTHPTEEIITQRRFCGRNRR